MDEIIMVFIGLPLLLFVMLFWIALVYCVVSIIANSVKDWWKK